MFRPAPSRMLIQRQVDSCLLLSLRERGKGKPQVSIPYPILQFSTRTLQLQAGLAWGKKVRAHAGFWIFK